MSDNGDSPAGRVMDRAIELAIEGCSPYPERALFLNEDCEDARFHIDRAIAEGLAVILVSPDESTRVIHPEGAKSKLG